MWRVLRKSFSTVGNLENASIDSIWQGTGLAHL